MKGAPKVGESYRQKFLLGRSRGRGHVLRHDMTAKVPAEAYRDVLVTDDTTPQNGAMSKTSSTPRVSA
jgi:hypothetical protein